MTNPTNKTPKKASNKATNRTPKKASNKATNKTPKKASNKTRKKARNKATTMGLGPIVTLVLTLLASGLKVLIESNDDQQRIEVRVGKGA